MRLLDRYLLRELLIPLGYCLCGFLIFWVSSDLFVTLGEFQKKGLSARDIAEYYVVITAGVSGHRAAHRVAAVAPLRAHQPRAA